MPDYLTVLAVTNVVAFAAFGIDKRSAVRGGRRIPESTLQLFGLLGPIGAWGGVRVFRHKTQRKMFLFLLVAVTIVHVVVLMVLLGRP